MRSAVLTCVALRACVRAQDSISVAVQAQMMKEQALAAHSRKAQYYERMQLKDEEFAFVDEEGLPTVEIVGEFTPTVRVLSLDTDEFVQLRDAFRRIKVCALSCMICPRGFVSHVVMVAAKG